MAAGEGGGGGGGGGGAAGDTGFFSSLATTTYDNIMPDAWAEIQTGPVHLLGVRYNLPGESTAFKRDFTSQLWFTYRNNFEPIADSGFSSDAGWGCMLRSGQMMMAHALVLRHLGRTWRLGGGRGGGGVCGGEVAANREKEAQRYRRLLRWFEDSPANAAYSIHRIAECGVAFGKEIGQWFAPTIMAQVMHTLARGHESSSKLRVLVAMDSLVFSDRIRELLTGRDRAVADAGADEGWRPVLLLVPSRLGLDYINPLYVGSVKATFAFPQSVGIIGGRPNSAYYFLGCHADHVVYLDPHSVKASVHMGREEKEEEEKGGEEQGGGVGGDGGHGEVCSCSGVEAGDEGGGGAASASTDEESRPGKSLWEFVSGAAAAAADAAAGMSDGVLWGLDGGRTAAGASAGAESPHGGGRASAASGSTAAAAAAAAAAADTTAASVARGMCDRCGGAIRGSGGAPFNTASYHCGAPRKMRVEDLDPSLCFGFFIRDEPDLDDFLARFAELSAREKNPIFSVMDSPSDMEPALSALESFAVSSESELEGEDYELI